MSGGSTLIIRGLLLLNIFDLFKFLDISYPPNVLQMFLNSAKVPDIINPNKIEIDI